MVKFTSHFFLSLQSGTVGNPKGVMLSHDNFTWDSYAIGKRLHQIRYAEEVLVSFLPLSHVAAQMVDIFLTLQFACTVYFADKDAMKGTLLHTLQEAKPTRMLAVPRVYEKIQEKMLAIGAQSGAAKKLVAGWAKSVTLQHHLDAMEGCVWDSLSFFLQHCVNAPFRSPSTANPPTRGSTVW